MTTQNEEKSKVLKMTKEQLNNYKWGDDLDMKENKNTNDKWTDEHNCSNCSYCFNCSNCSNLTNGLYCRNLKNEKTGYWICNVEVTKKEFEAKKKELGLK